MSRSTFILDELSDAALCAAERCLRDKAAAYTFAHAHELENLANALRAELQHRERPSE